MLQLGDYADDYTKLNFCFTTVPNATFLAPLGIWALRLKGKLASVPTEAVTRTLEIAASL
ncbi:hypothetical protein LCGC14_1207670 [marine sediment metagenome]|uniref:Uncharacterized protein n=1 Tax=marine sediment metagenome TaxID=412755 RepID=A0A0F9NXB8_9ZZZZ